MAQDFEPSSRPGRIWEWMSIINEYLVLRSPLVNPDAADNQDLQTLQASQRPTHRTYKTALHLQELADGSPVSYAPLCRYNPRGRLCEGSPAILGRHSSKTLIRCGTQR